MKKFNSDKLLLAVDSHHGIYAPQNFVEWYGNNLEKPLSNEYKKIFKDIDHPEYWEAWEDLMSKSIVIMEGKRYRIEQNEDTWLIPFDMETPEDWYI